MSGRYFSSYDGKTVMADVDVHGNSLELTIEDDKVKAIGNIPVGGGDESVWTDETFNALADDDGDDILDENDKAIGDEDAETLWATRDGVGFKAKRAEADINGNSLELHVNAEGKIDKIGDKYLEGTGETPVDAYSKAETDALLDGKANKSEMAVTDVSGDSTKKTIKLKDGLSQDVVVDISGKQDNLEFDGTYDASTNKVATVSTVEAAKCAVSYNSQTGELHLDFRGTVD